MKLPNLNDDPPTAYRGEEPFLFVSYDHDDTRVVLAEISALNGAGFRVSYDEGIHPGMAWHDELATAISKCSLFLLFVTPRSVASPMCQRELKFALDKQRPIIAVHLEETTLPDGIALAIGDRQAILSYRQSMPEYHKRLEAAVASFLVRPAAELETQPIPHAKLRFIQRAAVRWTAAITVVITLSVVGLQLTRVWQTSIALREQRAATLDEVRSLVRRADYGAAFTHLYPFVQRNSLDPEGTSLWKEIVLPMKPIVAQAGATVHFKSYNDVDGEWLLAGTSPIEHPIDAPRGVLRVRVEKPGYVTQEFAVANPGPSVDTTDDLAGGYKDVFHIWPVPLELSPEGALPEGFVRVPQTDVPVSVVGLTLSMTDDLRRPIPPFAIARGEVTNKEFKAFVDAHGYDNPSYWMGLRFADNGKAMPWSEARIRFVDRTGRPGPSSWEVGNYPAGAADLPVGGISWYEAVAYARFRGLAVPTIHHWARMSFGPFDEIFGVTKAVAVASRFSADAPAPESQDLGLGPWGTVNTAGNVREWVWNSAGDFALLMGGGWSDPLELADGVFPTSPFDRSAQNGLRLMQNLDSAPVLQDLLAPVELAVSDTTTTPISDQAFEAIRFEFTAASRIPLHIDTKVVDENDIWTSQEVTLKFTSGDPFVLYVILPRNSRGPLQPVLYAPTIAALSPQPNRDALSELRFVDFVVRGGRAIVIPIWAGMYERSVTTPSEPDAYFESLRQAMLAWHRDLVTTLDYLATRPDFDSEHVGIIGFSFGARVIVEPLLAIEARLKTAVLLSGGLQLGFPMHPIMDAVNYAPRTLQPVLMINGRYDNVVPLAKAQRLYFDLLATPSKDKRHVVYDCGHIDFPPNLEAKEVTDWFDRYLGPVHTADL